MSVLAVFLGLLLWTWIGRVGGTILGGTDARRPQSIGDHVAALKPVGRLMAR